MKMKANKKVKHDPKTAKVDKAIGALLYEICKLEECCEHSAAWQAIQVYANIIAQSDRKQLKSLLTKLAKGL